MPNASGSQYQGAAGSMGMGDVQILPMFLKFLLIFLPRAAVPARSEYVSPGIPMEKNMSIRIPSCSARETVFSNALLEKEKLLLWRLICSSPDSGEMAITEPAVSNVLVNACRKESEGREKDSK